MLQNTVHCMSILTIATCNDQMKGTMDTFKDNMMLDDGHPEHSVRAKLKDIALFFIAPFVGLAYIVAFPFVIFWVAVQVARKELLERASAKRQ